MLSAERIREIVMIETANSTSEVNALRDQLLIEWRHWFENGQGSFCQHVSCIPKETHKNLSDMA
jgi:hypothetical protein